MTSPSGVLVTRYVFCVPPGWPEVPAGWVPPEGFVADPGWPLPPVGWVWWVLPEDRDAAALPVEPLSVESVVAVVSEPVVAMSARERLAYVVAHAATGASDADVSALLTGVPGPLNSVEVPVDVAVVTPVAFFDEEDTAGVQDLLGLDADEEFAEALSTVVVVADRAASVPEQAKEPVSEMALAEPVLLADVRVEPLPFFEQSSAPFAPPSHTLDGGVVLGAPLAGRWKRRAIRMVVVGAVVAGGTFGYQHFIAVKPVAVRPSGVVMPASLVEWRAAGGAKIVDGIVADVSVMATAVTKKNASALGKSCAALLASVGRAQRFPALPDASMQSAWSSGLQHFMDAGAACSRSQLGRNQREVRTVGLEIGAGLDQMRAAGL